jgi:hypothetical protein
MHEFAGHPITESDFNERWASSQTDMGQNESTAREFARGFEEEDAWEDESYQIEPENVVEEGHNSISEGLGHGVD